VSATGLQPCLLLLGDVVRMLAWMWICKDAVIVVKSVCIDRRNAEPSPERKDSSWDKGLC